MEKTDKTNEATLRKVKISVARRDGKVTVGDIALDTGLGIQESEQALKDLLATHKGFLRVSENGDLVYHFDRNPISRESQSFLSAVAGAFYKGFKFLYKRMIGIMLIVYFTIYLVILIGILIASRGNNSSSSSSFNLGEIIMWYYFFMWHPERFQNRERRKAEPFVHKVHRFVFGPEREEQKADRRRREATALIASRQGVITAEEWMMISGSTRQDAENELARLTAEFDGEAEIGEDGEPVYTFKKLLRSGNRDAKTARPMAAWEKAEFKETLTGNETRDNAIITGINIFNLLASSFVVYLSTQMIPIQATVYDPVTYVPAISTEIAVLLGFVPLVFSLLFFIVPLLRMPGLKRRNTDIMRRNIRRVTYRHAFSSTPMSEPVVESEKIETSARLGLQKFRFEDSELGNEFIRESIRDDIYELNGEVQRSTVRGYLYDFGRLKKVMSFAEYLRKEKNYASQDLGRTVFSTKADDESVVDQSTLDLEDFDRRLQREEPKNHEAIPMREIEKNSEASKERSY